MDMNEMVTVRVPLTTLLDLSEKARKVLDVWRADVKTHAQERVFRLPRKVLLQVSELKGGR